MRILAAALTIAALSQTPAPQQPPPPAELVRIDVIVRDARGQLIENLKLPEFELREDGTLQTIEDLRYVTPQATDERMFAIFLDEYHVSANATEMVRQAIGRFVDQQLTSRDQAVVMRPLDSVLAIKLTRDRDEMHRAIDRFEGRKGDYSPRSAFERNYIANTPARAEAQRAQVAWSALNALAVHLGGLASGRKTIILVSEGLSPAEPRRGYEPLPTFASVVRSATRSTVSIYVVNPGRAEEGEHDLLRSLASDTDGTATSAGADLDDSLRRIVSDSSSYYLLTYRSARNSDGKFHPVDVRVKRTGVQVRARKGYYAPSPDDLMRARMLARGSETKSPPPIEPMRRISPLIRPWFGVARGSSGKTRVTFVWEAVRVPGDRSTRIPARIALKARTPDGTTVFDGTVLPSGGGAGRAGDESTARAVFDVIPGRLRLQMSIVDSAARQLDTDVRDIVVGSLGAKVALGTPEVLRARTARDIRALDADPNAVPVAAREFSRTERIVIRFPVYADDSGPPTISAMLMSRAGQMMRKLETSATPDGRNQIELPLAGFAAGEYSVEITASNPSGRARDLLNFRVTS